MTRNTAISNQSGFSLMEVLVALAVLAIAMAGLIKAAGSSSNSLAYLENKTIAHWVALNQIAEQQVAEFKSLGGSQGEERMAGRDWSWSVSVTDTPDLDVMRLDVEVRGSDDQVVYAKLIGYVERSGE